jgi:hypothetical protein
MPPRWLEGEREVERCEPRASNPSGPATEAYHNATITLEHKDNVEGEEISSLGQIEQGTHLFSSATDGMRNRPRNWWSAGVPSVLHSRHATFGTVQDES